MAANQGDISFATVALTGTTAKTVVGAKASANVAVKWLESCTTFDGATSTNAPAVAILGFCTFATNSPGTASTTQAPVGRDQDRTETFQLTSAVNWTTEPTVISIIRTFDPAQYMGFYHYINPFASPYVIKGGGGGVIRINSPNNVNTSGHMTVEE